MVRMGGCQVAARGCDRALGNVAARKSGYCCKSVVEESLEIPGQSPVETFHVIQGNAGKDVAFTEIGLL
uniref:Uncharacterized protein n=1 Tax=Ixodes ricinus TaxID=34613 RepID=A0A090XD84_IXORI